MSKTVVGFPLFSLFFLCPVAEIRVVCWLRISGRTSGCKHNIVRVEIEKELEIGIDLG